MCEIEAIGCIQREPPDQFYDFQQIFRISLPYEYGYCGIHFKIYTPHHSHGHMLMKNSNVQFI
jgi:hypothetical protein